MGIWGDACFSVTTALISSPSLLKNSRTRTSPKHLEIKGPFLLCKPRGGYSIRISRCCCCSLWSQSLKDQLQRRSRPLSATKYEESLESGGLKLSASNNCGNVQAKCEWKRKSDTDARDGLVTFSASQVMVLHGVPGTVRGN